MYLPDYGDEPVTDEIISVGLLDGTVWGAPRSEEAQSYADEESLLFFETSAKTGHNVTEVFTAIANAIPETSLKNARGPGASSGAVGRGGEEQRVNLNGPREAAKEGCAC